ncbi:MAG: cobalamin biosynthesis protein [Alphaproteobacteria bacterium]
MPEITIADSVKDGFDGLSRLDWAGGPEPALLLLAALLLSALFGRPRGLFHYLPDPNAALEVLTRGLAVKLNRKKRSSNARMVRGLLTLFFVTGLAAAAGGALIHFVKPMAYGWLAELALVALLIAPRAGTERAFGVARRLKEGDAPSDPDIVDGFGWARRVIEGCAGNFTTGVVAPVFWFLILGLPGLAAYRAIEIVDRRAGRGDERAGAFGVAIARVTDAVNFLPARLAGILIAAAAFFTPSARAGGGLQVMFRDAGHGTEPGTAWPQAAVAGALGLALQGPKRVRGRVLDAPWLGDGRARATPLDIRRTLLLYAVACLILGTLILAVTAARHAF